MPLDIGGGEVSDEPIEDETPPVDEDTPVIIEQPEITNPVDAPDPIPETNEGV